MEIQHIQVGMQVASLDAQTGALGFKAVEAQYSNPYDEIIRVTVKDEDDGSLQTITSNRIHPYFVQTKRVVQASSEGHSYQGPLDDGHWIDAGNLLPGDCLLNADGTWGRVTDIGHEVAPLTAYNLTVVDYHTYFVAGNPNADAVWVHNNCFDKLPNGAKPTGGTNNFGQKTYKGPNGENLYQGHDGRFYDAAVHTPTSRKLWLQNAAEKHGFSKTNFTIKGQPVYKKGNRYISPDADSHNGGAWKMANSVKDLARKSTRIGTFDINLVKIGE